ncbi:hypothetical protein PPERSA_06859 [Pseudocohnilembus persalinus]|uniref:Transmembrane protein n=1 Tax=Pseudocohnilembus persalinus TaxID=266149 RepID=A0A0V0QSC5_PSEPJ|nr:hypothetical protein PPERSA_06859 [Pseudocohnilembus persalinus]|eukprot:KRX05225.1 hypothetical protein PPERSA_06859 [Pseudocohnilembus persalinus]
MADRNYKFWGNGDKNDIPLSYEEYFEIIDTVQDERLSKEGIMKFKNLHEINSYGLLYVPVYTMPFAFLLTRAITGPAKRGHSGYRNLWTLMSLNWPLACWFGYTQPIPRKLYTDILADQGPDGSYVRQSIKQQRPGLWRKLSRRLHTQKYVFPEMLENTNKTEFPTDFVSPNAL